MPPPAPPEDTFPESAPLPLPPAPPNAVATIPCLPAGTVTSTAPAPQATTTVPAEATPVDKATRPPVATAVRPPNPSANAAMLFRTRLRARTALPFRKPPDPPLESPPGIRSRAVIRPCNGSPRSPSAGATVTHPVSEFLRCVLVPKVYEPPKQKGSQPAVSRRHCVSWYGQLSARWRALRTSWGSRQDGRSCSSRHTDVVGYPLVARAFHPRVVRRGADEVLP